ncbi:MAG TPA: hypothetical protein VEX66_10260 [Microlunatus sp.]|nr:hypothetical protein [Microlunatus sp.]
MHRLRRRPAGGWLRSGTTDLRLLDADPALAAVRLDVDAEHSPF